jgi:hypothetical protein
MLNSVGRRLPTRWLWLSGLAVLAFVVRLVPVLTGGGLSFYGRYDDSVYYSAAVALTFGRLPYKDFTLLHPPALMLFLTPFAWLGRITTDATGMGTARLVFMAIGAVNTVLVASIARRWGPRAAIVGGLMYAGWLPAVYGEQSTMLEPLGSTALCVALLMLLRRNRPTIGWEELVAGIALGFAVTDKIWYVAPLFSVVVWQFVARNFRAAVRIVAAAAATVVVLITPFAILTGRHMWDMVIRDQLGRPQGVRSRFTRLTSIFGLKAFATGQATYLDVLTFVGIAVLIGVVIACCRQAGGPVLVWVFAVNLAVLMAAPPYYQHYAAFTAVPGTLLVAVAAARLERLPRLAMRAGLAATIGLIIASTAAVITSPTGRAFPAAFRTEAPPGCTTADDPQALIDMNRLSRDLRLGCRLPVDVTGITFDRLASSTERRYNLPWQRYLVDYLVSGTSFVVIRGTYDEPDHWARRTLRSHPIIAAANSLYLRSG